MKKILLKQTYLFGLPITTSNINEILEYMSLSLQDKAQRIAIFTPNPEMVMLSQRNKRFKSVLGQAQINLPDGVGLIMAAGVLGVSLKKRISGIDFMEKLCRESAKKQVLTGFLGGKDNVALKTAECLQVRYPGLKVGFVGEEWESGVFVPYEYQGKVSEYFLKKDVNQNKELNSVMDVGFHSKNRARSKEKILSPTGVGLTDREDERKQVIDILFVAFGAPKQELWIAENLASKKFRVGMGVGGSFDYLSGKISRAPKILQSLGFEWLYRLFRQPWRLKRQLALLSFVFLVLREKMSPSRADL